MLVVNHFLWVKHLLFQYTFAINTAVVIVLLMHVSFHYFELLVKCYLNPECPLYFLSLAGRGGGEEE